MDPRASGERRMKALVTGGLGFVGSNLVDELVDLNYDVLVVDDLSSGKEEYKNPKAEYIIADFKEYMSTPDNTIDVVFHLAAEARIQPSFDDPLYTCFNNAYGTSVVCEFVRNSKCMLVYAGSSSFYAGVYETPYAFAKWQGEEVIKMYSKVYGIECGIARFFNVYGPRNPQIGQYTPVIAIFERQFKNNNPLTVVGDGEQRRDFTHVSDICSGLIAISHKNRDADVYNLGTGINYSINQLVEMFSHPKVHIPSRPGEARISLADITKSNKDLGWHPKYNLKEYIGEIIK
jgi:UDP-glucose 4-epimerase